MFSTVQLIMVSGQCPLYLIITRRDPGIDKACREEKETRDYVFPVDGNTLLLALYAIQGYAFQKLFTFRTAFQRVAELEAPKLWDWN